MSTWLSTSIRHSSRTSPPPSSRCRCEEGVRAAPGDAIIRESIVAIERYRPAEKRAFLASPVIQDAILMRLQVIGEHLARMRRIDEGRFAEIVAESWYQVIRLRNVVSHGYEAIDRERIWEMVADELPELATSLVALDHD